MMNNQITTFKKALEHADKSEVDMSWEDWARATGLMRDHGHGYIWEDFTEEEAKTKIEAYAEEMEAE